MKRFLSALLIATLITISPGIGQVYTLSSVCASENEDIELEDGYYWETVIEDDDSTPENSPLATTRTITKTKTTYLKNSSGEVVLYVSIKATFSYNGTTATCTSYTPNGGSNTSVWRVQSVTGSKSGNSATTKGVFVHLFASGSTATCTKSVTITCSPTGVVS